MFDHLDDDTPIEPTDAVRDAVAQRAGALRRRRAVLPGAALVVVAAIAIGVVAVAANDDDAPSRVVAGPNGPAAAEPVSAAVTRDGITVRASIPSGVVAPGTTIAVSTEVENGTEVGRAIDLKVCVVDRPTTGGWTSAAAPCETGSVLEVDAGAEVTRELQVVAPAEPGDHTVFLRWSDPPSGDFLPLPFRVAGNVSAETLTARIELDSDTVVAGGEVTGDLVIENPTDKTIDLRPPDGCTPNWGVMLVEPGARPNMAFTTECGSAPLLVEPGTNRWAVQMRASHQLCAESSTDDTPKCLDGGGIPPLPPGRYEAAFAPADGIDGLPVPAPVAVRVIARNDGSAETLTARLELDDATVEAGGTVEGALVLHNPTDAPIELYEAGGGRCTPMWTVYLAPLAPSTSEVTWTAPCGTTPLVVPPGTTRLPFAASQIGDYPRPGDFEATFFRRTTIPGLPTPEPVPVTVTE